MPHSTMSTDGPSSPSRRVGFANGDGILHADDRVESDTNGAPDDHIPEHNVYDDPNNLIDDAEGYDYDDNDTEMTSIADPGSAAFLEIDDDDDDEGAESVYSPESIYPPSRYAPAPSLFRSSRMADNFTVYDCDKLSLRLFSSCSC